MWLWDLQFTPPILGVLASWRESITELEAAQKSHAKTLRRQKSGDRPRRPPTITKRLRQAGPSRMMAHNLPAHCL
jgi:hypothetical protein